MKNYFKNAIVLTGLCFSILSCGGEDLDDLEAQTFSQDLVTADISYSELYGKWKLNQLTADTLVDINGDATFNTNLRAETTCFDQMTIIFFEDQTYASVNARMDFAGGENNDQFICMDSNSAPETGKWDIVGNILIMEITVDGVKYTHEKELTLTGNFFSFKVNRLESQQYYNDPGNTVASKVNIISSEYIRSSE